MESSVWPWEEIFLGLIPGILIALIIAWLFRYKFLPEPEQILNKNTNFIRKQLFEHLDEANYWKNRIFEILESVEKFDPLKDKSCQLTENQFDQMDYAQKMINDQIKNIDKLRKMSNTILLEEYIEIKKYLTSLNSFIIPISNDKHHIFFDLKALEFARFYAKNIIELIGKKDLVNFNLHWQSSFNTVGGISKIEEPKIELGDIPSIHHDFRNELFYYDVQHSEIMIKLTKINRDIDLICNHFKIF